MSLNTLQLKQICIIGKVLLLARLLAGHANHPKCLCNVYKQKPTNELYETLLCNYILLIAVKLHGYARNWSHSSL